MDDVQKLLGDNPTIWIFGYGSLLWKPDFQYKSKKIGYIKDYQRRFYQGNVTFRGKPGQPGRVANLVEKKGKRVWGVAYEIYGRDEVTQVLQGLYTRETASGGYVTMVTTFYPREEPHKNCPSNSTTLKSNLGLSPGHFNNFNSHFQPSLNKNSSISDLSITMSEDTKLYEDSTKAKAFKTKKQGSENQLHSPTHSMYDPHENVDMLLHFLHEFSSYSSMTEESRKDSAPVRSSSKKYLYSTSHPSESPRSNYTETAKNFTSAPVQVLLYTATPDNDLYLGREDMTTMAHQIVSASGSAGTNIEYVTKIADYVRKYIPEDQDSHLFTLDNAIKELVYAQHAVDSIMFTFDFVGFGYDLHDLEHELITEPVMAL